MNLNTRNHIFNRTLLFVASLFFSVCVNSHNIEAATFVTDTFTDTAGVNLTAHTGEVGATWVKNPNFSGNIFITDANRTRDNSGTSAYYSSGVPASANYTVQADVYTQSIGSSTDYIGPAARMSTSASTFYWAFYNDSSSQWTLAKFVAGSYTSLGTYNATLTSSTTYSVTLSVNGTSLVVAINGVDRITVTDSSISAAGKAGILASVAVTNSTGQHLDNFSATDLIAPATSYTLTGPTSGSVSIPSTNFTITPNGLYSGVITPSDSSGGGTFSPTSLTFSSSSTAQTFTYTAGSSGTKTISVTSSPGLSNPTSLTYTVAVPLSWVSQFTDTFTRADGSIGNGWLGATSTATISSNKSNVTVASGNTWSAGLLTRPVNETTADQRVTATYLAGSSGDLWIALRTQSAGTEYILGISRDGHANIWKAVSDVLTGSLIQTAFTYNSAHDYKVDVSATGFSPTTLVVSITDLNTSTVVANVTTTDSTAQLQQNGQTGFFAAQASLSLDDYVAYSLSTTATSYTLTGPTSGFTNTASTNFTVTPNGMYTGTITPASTGAGTFSPTSLSFSSSSTAQTFTYTATSTASSPHTISSTSSPTLTNPSSIAYAVTIPLISVAVNNSSLYWSRSNVYLNGSSSALMVTTGSYLKTNFTGTSIAVNLDVSALATASVSSINYPIVRYQVDGGSWTTTQLTSATSSLGFSGLSSGTHSFKFVYVSSYTSTDKWNTPVSPIKITSLSIDSGSSVSAPTILAKTIRVDGDSITEGLRAVNAGDTPAGNSAVLAYPHLLAESLNTELTQIGYGSQGWATSGQGNVPTYPNAVDYYYNAVSRLSNGALPQAPDYWLVNQGTNDGGDITSAYLTRISQMRTEAGSTTKLFLLVPFNQSHKSQITSAYNSYVAANPSDTRVHLLDLGSISYGTTDGLHPNTAGHQTLATALYSSILATLDTTSPIISSIASSVSQTSATITSLTDEATSYTINYGPTSSYGSIFSAQSLTTSHSNAITGLTASTTYHFQIVALDIDGNSTTSSDYTFTTSPVPDTTSPLISSITSSSVSASGASITWITDEAATSQIEYGTSSTYTNSSVLDSTVTTTHTVHLTGISSNTTYHYRVISVDASNNTGTSLDQTFTTLNAARTLFGGSSAVAQARYNAMKCTTGARFDSNEKPCLIPITDSPQANSFTKNLKVGMTDPQVKLLQQYLNSKGYKVSLNGAGSPGFESMYFGPSTKAALIKFQKSRGILPAVGYFGSITRKKIIGQ